MFAIYCGEMVLVALFAALIGAALGAALPFAIAWAFGAIIPLPVAPSLHPGTLALSIVYGLLTALAFALWPLGRAHDISVSMLFRDQIAAERHWPRRRYVVATAAIVAVLAALAVTTTYDHRIAAIFVASAIGVFVMLRLLAMLTMAIARRLPRARSTVLRLAIANIHRPGALTPTVVLSLGLGLALLVTVIEIDGNLHREFTAALPEKAPSFFFLDIPAADADRFDAFVRDQAPASTLERVPMLRGRIVAANGIKAEDLKPAAGSRWVLQGDRGITYASAVPAGSRIVAGQWWSADYSGEPLVSLESKTAARSQSQDRRHHHRQRARPQRHGAHRQSSRRRLGKPRHQFRPGVLARHVRRRAAQRHRHADLRRRRHGGGGHHRHQGAGRRFPDGHRRARQGRARHARRHHHEPGAGARAAPARSRLIAAALVLGGALAAGQRFRIYDAVVLKTFGATRARLLAAYALEYLFIGAATVLFGVAMGSLAADLIVTRVMEFPFVFVAGQAAGAALAALAVTVVARPCRHVHGARPQARGGAAESLIKRATGGQHERIVTLANMASHPSGARGAFRTRFPPSEFGVVSPNAKPG